MKKIAALMVLFSIVVFAQQYGSFTDSRDGKRYQTVKIGTKTWMAENLNYNENGSKCYENKSYNCQKYGRLYNWATAKAACPNGWHLPGDNEWLAEGTDILNYSALPGGAGYSYGDFQFVGDNGYWWSATGYDAAHAYSWLVYYGNAGAYSGRSDKSDLYSVRCVHD